jgi:putative ABC transport system ATP-binding protein
MSKKVVIKVDNVAKTFKVGKEDVEILKGVSTEIYSGNFFVIFGPSGSGKSTLLHTILGLEPPTSGNITVLDEDFYKMSEDERSTFRKTRIGIVYQQPHWIKSLSVIENVAFPLFLMGQMPSEALPKAEKILELVEMSHRMHYFPTELSSGQQQRVSLARALISDPTIIVADEPTGNLDTKSGDTLMQYLSKLNKEGRTIVMVTHDLEYMKYADRMIRIVDGNLDDEYTQKDREKLLAKVAKKRGTKADQEFEMSDNVSGEVVEKNKNPDLTLENKDEIQDKEKIPSTEEEPKKKVKKVNKTKIKKSKVKKKK